MTKSLSSQDPGESGHAGDGLAPEVLDGMPSDVNSGRAPERFDTLNSAATVSGDGAARGAREAALEILTRCAAALMLSIFAYAVFMRWRAEPSRITLLLLMAGAFLTLGLALFARVPRKRDWTPFAYICSIGGTFYFLFVQLAPGTQVIPEAVGASLQLFGIFWQFFSKLSLRRSFGILPANRGVVSSGAYRFVRHPMYLGYFLMDIGFLLVNFGLQNVIVYGCEFALQIGRIIREERLLSDDAEYRAYKSRVRWRVIPWFF